MAVRTRIEISYNRGEEGFSASDVQLPIVLGFGLHHAWMFSTLFTDEKTFTGMEAGMSYFAGLYFTISLVVFVASLTAHALAERRIRDRFCARRTIVISSVVLALSTATVVTSAVPGPIGTASFIIGSTLSGVSSSCLILLWGHVFADCDIPSIVINTVLAFAAGIAFCSLVVHRLPYPYYILLAAALPLAEGVLLCRATASMRTVASDDTFVPQCLPIRKAAFVRRTCAPAIILGVATGFVGQSSLRTVLAGTNPDDQIVVVAAACLTALLIIVCVFLTQTQRLNFLYRPLLPISAIALLLIPQLARDALFTHLVLILGFLFLETLLWVTPSEISSRYRISPLFTFGLFRGCLAAGTLCVDFAQRWYTTHVGGTLVLTDFSIVAIALVALVCGYVLLPQERDMAALAISPALDEQDAPADEQITGVEPNVEHGSSPTSPASGTAPASEQADAPSSSKRSATASPTKEEASSDSERKGGRFVQRCQAIADHYLLTKKETEVLFLLAKGRNAAAIQEHLVVSENTVRTHMRHIYRKLDVHTQQEIIDLVDGKRGRAHDSQTEQG